MSWVVVLGTPFLILALGLGLEAGTIISYERNGKSVFIKGLVTSADRTPGFKVPQTNVFPIVSPQFLLVRVPLLSPDCNTNCNTQSQSFVPTM